MQEVYIKNKYVIKTYKESMFNGYVLIKDSMIQYTQELNKATLFDTLDSTENILDTISNENINGIAVKESEANEIVCCFWCEQPNYISDCEETNHSNEFICNNCKHALISTGNI